MGSVEKNQVTIDINADVSGLKRGTAEAKASVESLSRTFKQPAAALEEVSSKTVQATRNFSVMGISVAAAVTTMLFFTRNTLNAADALNDMHLRTGVSIKDLAGLSTIAQQSGTSLGSVAEGLKYLTVNIGKAEQGQKEYAASLKRLGVDSKDPKEALYQVADAVKASNEPTKLAADLQKVLGRGWTELVPLLKEGGDGLRKAAQENEGFAETMARLAPDADKFNDNLVQMKTNAAGFAASILSDVVPALNEFYARMERISKLSKAGASLFEIATGGVSADTGASLKRVNAEVADLESTIARLRKNSGGKDQSIIPLSAELSRLKALRAELQAMEVERLMAPPGGRSAAAPPSSDPKIDFSAAAAGKTKTRGIDKADIYNDEMARNAKLIADETDRIAGDYAFMADVDIKQNTASFKQEWIDAGRALKEEMTTPLEQFDQRLEYINELWRVGAIDIETYDRAMADAFDKNAPKMEKTRSLAEDIGLSFTSAFEDAIVGGESFGDVLKGLEQDLLRLAVRKGVTEPMMNAIGSFDFSSLMPSAQGNVFAGGTGLSAYRNTVVDRPTTFAFAQGVMGEKIGSPGEAIMPLQRMSGGDLGVKVAGGGGGTMIVKIIESPGNGGKTEQRQDNNGANILDVYVEQIKGSIAGDISSGRGAIPGALAGTYGLNRVAGAY